jgi:hypothetical protein
MNLILGLNSGLNGRLLWEPLMAGKKGLFMYSLLVPNSLDSDPCSFASDPKDF